MALLRLFFSASFSLVCLLGWFLTVPSLSANLGENPSAGDLRAQIAEVETIRSQGDYDKAVTMAMEILDHAQNLNSPEILAEAYLQVVLSHYFADSFDQARSFLEIGISHARLHDMSSAEADFLNARGVIEWKAGNLWLAQRELEQAMTIKRETGDSVAVANIANNMGNIAYAMERYTDAVHSYQRALRELGDQSNPRLRAALLSNIGESLLRMDRLQEAEDYLQQSMQLEQKLKDPHYLAYTYFNLGELRSRQNNFPEARRLYQKAIHLQEENQNRWGSSLSRLHLARALLAEEKPEAALKVLAPGYRDAKSLNALDLLRDYSDGYASIYRHTGQHGLEKYYRELHQWFQNRLRKANSPDPGTANTPPETTTPPSPEQTASLFPWRAAVLLLLLLIVGLLLVENHRLRAARN